MRKDYINYYNIKVEFDKRADKPSRVFYSLADLIESFQRIDKMFINSISCSIKFKQVLDEVEKGSVIAKIMEFITLDDQRIFGETTDENSINEYMSDSRKAIASSLCKGGNLKLADFERVRSEVAESAKKTQVNKFQTFALPEPFELANQTKLVIESLNHLSDKDKAIFETQKEKFELSKSVNINIDQIEKELTDNVIENTIRMFLKIKQPDMLGNSSWEFKHLKEKIIAKILDEKWFTEFKDGKVPLKAGDSMDVDLHHIAKYDKLGNCISQNKSIIKVHNIISNNPESIELL
jgi:hypothetical protein